MTLLTDRYAYNSKLKNKSPSARLLFSLLTMSVCLWADNLIISITVLFIMGFTATAMGGTRLAVFLKLLTVPAVFLLTGTLTIAFNISGSRDMFLFSVPLFGAYIGVTKTGIIYSLNLLFKALGAASCLYYLSLSTPFAEIMNVLRMMRVPKLLTEIMGLVYRYIFLLYETTELMMVAQKSRLGYSGVSSCYHSLAALASMVFIRSFRRTDRLYKALEARCYGGELCVLEEHKKTCLKDLSGPFVINLVLVAGAVFIKLNGGGFFHD